MRICFINLDYAPHRSSGLGAFGETLANGLVGQGHAVQVVTRAIQGQPTDEVLDGVRIHRVPGGRLDWISFARQAARAVGVLAEIAPFDVVHFADVHFAYAYRGPYVASAFQSFTQRLKANGGRPAHTGYANLVTRLVYYSMARWLAERPAVSRAQLLIAASRTTARAYADEYRLTPEQICTVRCGIDTSRFTPTPSDLRERLGLGDGPVLLFVGFCGPRKGLEYLASALRQLPPEVRLLVIGRWDENYYRRVEAALGDAAPRMLALGYVPDDELPAYYSLADLFVTPSLLEGFGLPIAEALACGTPVVTTSAGACPEIVGPGGLVVPPMDSMALARAISSLLANPTRRQAMAALGRTWALKQLGVDRMIAGHLAAYERALRKAF